MTDPFDDFDADDDRAFDLLHDDGWTPGEIADRQHVVEGEYQGPKA
jgi:hypothetical protein